MEKPVVSTEERTQIESETDVTDDNKVKNETVTTELHFELLKQYAWLSSVIIGASVVLVQLKIVTFSPELYFPFICFGASILMSLFGQDFIVDSLSKGKTIYCIAKKVKVYRYSSMFTLFIGVGLLTGRVAELFA